VSRKERFISARLDAQEAREAALTERRRSHPESVTPEGDRCELLYNLARGCFAVSEQAYAAGDWAAGYDYWEQGQRFLADALVCEGIPVI
jgi:hypothetical protein